MRTDAVAVKAEVTKRLNLKEQLLQHMPDLLDDDEALMDTLDGETNVKEMLAALARASKEREAMAKSCKELAAIYTDRAKRHLAAQEGIKIWAMLQLGEKSLKHAHVTLSLRDLDDKIHVIADDIEMVSDDYVSMTEPKRYVDTDKIAAAGLLLEAIEDGVVRLETDRKSVTIRA